MSHTGIIAGGFIIVIIGIGLIFTTGVDLSNLPMLDFTAKIGDAEFTATDIPPEAQTQLMSGIAIAIIGTIVIGIGTATTIIWLVSSAINNLR